MKKLSILAIFLLPLACNSTKIGFDYDRNADFNKYKTYRLTDDSNDLAVGQLDRNRILKAVESEMRTKGFTRSDTPDALLDVRMKTQQKHTAHATTTTTGGFYGYRYGTGFGTTTVNYDDYTEGTLFITLIDAKSNQVLWQGTGSRTLSETSNVDKKEANITYSVNQIMANYPPKS